MSAALPLGAWELPEELALLRDTVARFMREEVRPIEEKQPHDCYELPAAELAGLQQKAKALGLWCLASPSQYGGGGLGLLAQVLIAEEAAKCRMGAYVPACGAFGIDPPSVIWLGNAQQIEKYGVAGIKAGKKSFVAISEASGGADPARSITTRARRDGDHYVLNGTKMWITAADKAEWGLVFARTGDEGDRGGISCFIVDRHVPGIKIRPIPVIRSYEPFEVHLENVRIPVENRLGAEGEGFQVCQKWLVHARVPYAAGVIGVAQEALRLAVDWVRQRKTFKSHLSDKQAVQWMVADSEMELQAARLLTYQAAWRADLGHDIKIEASIAKVMATETAGRVIDRCVQMFGALGVSKELPLERWYREMRIKRIGEGPSEVHRMVLARHILSGKKLNRVGENIMSIDFELDEGVALITINRPERSNALDAEHYAALSDAWKRVRDDAAINVAVITGAGEKTFCAGADLKSWVGREVELAELWLTQQGQLLNRGLEIWKPVIAAVNGACVGGGMTLLLATDIRVATESAVFSLAEVKRGIIAANGGTQRIMQQLPYAIAMEMLLTGDKIDAATALRWGLINKVVPQSGLRDAALEYAHRIAKNAPLALQAAKELALRSRDMDLPTGLRMEQLVNRILHHSEDTKTAKEAFANKQQPKFKGR